MLKNAQKSQDFKGLWLGQDQSQDFTLILPFKFTIFSGDDGGVNRNQSYKELSLSWIIDYLIPFNFRLPLIYAPFNFHAFNFRTEPEIAYFAPLNFRPLSNQYLEYLVIYPLRWLFDLWKVRILGQNWSGFSQESQDFWHPWMSGHPVWVIEWTYWLLGFRVFHIGTSFEFSLNNLQMVAPKH